MVNVHYHDERGKFRVGNRGGGRPIGVTTKPSKARTLKQVREEITNMAMVDAISIYGAQRDKAVNKADTKAAEFCWRVGGLEGNTIEVQLPPITDNASALVAISNVVAKIAGGELTLEQGKILTDTISKYVATSMKGAIGDGTADLHGMFRMMVKGIGVSDLAGQIIDTEAANVLEDLRAEGILEGAGKPVHEHEQADPTDDTPIIERASAGLQQAEEYPANYRKTNDQMPRTSGRQQDMRRTDNPLWPMSGTLRGNDEQD